MNPIEMKQMSLPNGRTVNFYTVTRIGAGQYVKINVPRFIKTYVATFTMQEFEAMYQDALKHGFELARNNPEMKEIAVTKQEVPK